MTRIAILRRVKTVLIVVWALSLLALVPVFFLSYGGGWLHRLAELWPLVYP
jgi:hypothetical protein